MNVYEIVTERVIKYIEENKCLPWTKPWAVSNITSRSNQNISSGTIYKGINMILTAMSGFSCPYWITVKQANAKGGKIKSGEKGTPILYWNTYDKKDDENGDDDEKTFKNRGFYRYSTVFNLEQCEGIDIPQIVGEAPSEIPVIEVAEQVVKNMRNCPPIKHGGNDAAYSSKLDSIKMPPVMSFALLEQYYSALFHEIAHSTGHKSRLDRFTEDHVDHVFASKSYGKEELVAEMTASFIMNEIGIESANSELNSAAYLISWVNSLKGDSKLIVQAASKAMRAANYIMNRIEEKKEAVVA